LSGAQEVLAEATRERTLAEDQRTLSQSKLTAQRETVQQLEKAVEEMRGTRDESRSTISELRVRQATQLQDAEHLREEYREEFHQELPTLQELREAFAAAAALPAETNATEFSAAPGEADAAASEASEAVSHGTAALRAVDSDQVVVSGSAPTAEAPAPTLAELFRVPENLAELRADLAEKRDQLQKMGPVNVLAAEEYSEQEVRFTFLSEQRADVQHSILGLRKTIEEINATSQERFLATFTVVNEAFGQVFANLFRGGEASMRLLDEDDPTESGIEIVARPPGKRLQNIQLMSGGEKALTAIALLFALFQTKPSPFCILDEVDAPLDDANVLRFVTTLQEMATDTQFLVVTHNKLTMECASSLYGVTMAEKGVSKLVGVDIDELHPQSLTA
jgi:chromosome segregation protein